MSETRQSEEDIFRQKADHYLVCFNDQCPCRERCLRWLTGIYTDPQLASAVSVNLRNPKIGGEQCMLFRPKVRITMKRGMLQFYVNMTGRQEHAIRQTLINIYNRKVYYQMRNGLRLITHEQQQEIEQVCRNHGWNGPYLYDGEDEDYAW